ncbi:MAG: hypothetical protein BJ554DRAFT_7533, partial [Olpidium bornovanus]
ISEEYVPLVRRFELARHRILDALGKYPYCQLEALIQTVAMHSNRCYQPNTMLPVEAGRISVAFSLSERQQDFKALIKLLMSDPAKERRLEGYMQRFGRPFADTLNEYYVENGDLKALLQQPDSRDQTLADFLDRRDEGAFYPESQEGGWEEEPSKLPRDLAEVAWIHDVKIGRFDKSWKRVRKVAGRETSGSSKVVPGTVRGETSSPGSRYGRAGRGRGEGGSGTMYVNVMVIVTETFSRVFVTLSTTTKHSHRQRACTFGRGVEPEVPVSGSQRRVRVHVEFHVFRFPAIHHRRRRISPRDT